jgi:hypothetical protein
VGIGEYFEAMAKANQYAPHHEVHGGHMEFDSAPFQGLNPFQCAHSRGDADVEQLQRAPEREQGGSYSIDFVETMRVGGFGGAVLQPQKGEKPFFHFSWKAALRRLQAVHDLSQ